MLRATRPQGAAPAAPQAGQAPAPQAAPQPQYQEPAETAPAPGATPQTQYQAPQYQDGQAQYAPQPGATPAPQPQYQAPAAAPAPQYQAPQQAPQYGAPQQGAAPQGGQPLALGNGNVASLNAGVLENVDGVGNIGNYVIVDGSDFLYKSSDRKAQYLDVNIHYGKRFYQWVDETNPNAKQYHNSDTKLDDRYKLKMEIRWYEPGEDNEPVEYIMSLSTTSSIQFLDFVKKLAKAGLGVGQVWTRMTISRHNRPNSTERYSRVDFEAFSLETGQPLGIKSNG